MTTTSHTQTKQSRCPVCNTGFTPNRRQAYCTHACRQAAWRSRQENSRRAQLDDAPAGQHRREVTIYRCPDCDQPHLAQQWCPDCNTPCHREGTGGLCPHCDEPITINELLARGQNP